MQRPTSGESLAPIVIALVIALLLSPVVRDFTRDLVRGSQRLRHPAPASAGQRRHGRAAEDLSVPADPMIPALRAVPAPGRAAPPGGRLG